MYGTFAFPRRRHFVTHKNTFFTNRSDIPPQICNMLSLLQTFIERFLIRNLHQSFHFLTQLPTKLLPQTSASFREKLSCFQALLETQEETSDSVNLALKELNLFPPQIQIIPKGVWPKDSANRIRIQTHLKSTFADAVALLRDTGRDLSSSDEKYLHLLLTHDCGWSATYPEHMTDDWVKFFNMRYPQLKGLVPILDSMTYREELSEFPMGFRFKSPRFFLLATFDCYYIYDATDGGDGLCIAGKTLEEVYIGLRDWRWAEVSEDPWDGVYEQEYLNPSGYFPTYFNMDNGNFGMWGAPYHERFLEIPRKVQTGIFKSLFRR
jgi:hypothetical protein